LKKQRLQSGQFWEDLRYYFREFLELQVGDVIRLDRRKNQEIEVFVGDKLKFYGVPGRKEGRVAIKVTRVEKEDESR